MVITVYSDRRSGEIGDIAFRLAESLAALVDHADVALFGPTPRAAARGVRHTLLEEGSAPADFGELLATDVESRAAAVFALSGPPTEYVIAAFDTSDRVLLVGDPSVPSIRGIQRTLKLCHSLGYSASRVVVVLHGFSDDAPLAADEAARALKREIFWVLPGAAASVPERAQSYTGLAQRLLHSDEAQDA